MVRMGISTGYCTVGNFGSDLRLDYTVLGSPVNLAARLQSMAEPGEIIIDELTTEIPHHRVEEAKKLNSILGESKIENSFFSPSTSDPVEACLRMTWRPALSVVGADGLPSRANASFSLSVGSICPFGQMELPRAYQQVRS